MIVEKKLLLAKQTLVHRRSHGAKGS